jgi:hypothetical protein
LVRERAHQRTGNRAGNRASKRDKDDLDDGAVEELLFGWFEGRNREGRKQRAIRCLQSSFSPIISDQKTILTRIFHYVPCATDNDSLRARRDVFILTHILSREQVS